MKLSSLTPVPGSIKNRKRVGRGLGQVLGNLQVVATKVQDSAPGLSVGRGSKVGRCH